MLRRKLLELTDAIKNEEDCYIKYRHAQTRIDELEEEIEGIVGKEDLRPIKPEDVKVYNYVFLDDGCGAIACRYIIEVMNPKDDWKGFVGNDGCRYGLYETYVLKWLFYCKGEIC